MKALIHRFAPALFVVLAVGTGCGSQSSDSASFAGAASEPGGPGGPGGPGAPGTPGAPSPGSGTAAERGASESGTPGEKPQAGQMTSGVWDDNLNYDFFAKYLTKSRSLTGLPEFTDADRIAARDRASQRAPRQELDVAILFDTTGSMGDELRYLTSELDAIAATIATKFPTTKPRFAYVVYKDRGDAYVTQKMDFTTDVAAARAGLVAQTAGGGGDYPEAVAEGLTDTVGLGWRGGDVARMVFWIGDAPHHVGEEGKVKTAIEGAVAKGIHVYPIAASGTDDRAEYTMRTAAQLTGGRYLFLTDDSGIGDPHAEPHIPCYHVTRLDHAMVRMVEGELRGSHVSPEASAIVRTVGQPKDGKCVLKDSQQVSIY